MKRGDLTIDRAGWMILSLVFFSSFSFLFAMQIIPPLLPTIMSDYGIGHATASALMWGIALPGVLFSLPAGALTNRYGVKSIGSLGLQIFLLGGLISAIAPSYPVLVLGRLISGIGGILIIVSSQTILPLCFPGKSMGLAMGILALNMPLATIIAFNLPGRLFPSLEWRNTLWLSLGIGVTALILFQLYIPEMGGGSRRKGSMKGLKEPQLWILGAIWAFFNMAALSYTTWGKKFFIDYKELSPEYSDFLASLLMMGALTAPLGGHLSDRLGKRRLQMILSALSMAILFPLIPSLRGSWLLIILALLGLLAALLPPPTFALPAQILKGEKVGMGYGILNTCLNIGIVLGPWTIGLLADLLHSEMVVFNAMALFSLITLLLCLLLKEVKGEH